MKIKLTETQLNKVITKLLKNKVFTGILQMS